MATEKQALIELRNILSNITVPQGSPNLGGVYIWPDDYEDMPDVLTVPSIMVAKKAGPLSVNQISRKAHGLERHKWFADILVYVAEGPLLAMDSGTAAAEKAASGWSSAIAATLWANQSLNGSVQIIGQQNGDMFEIFNYVEGHIPYGNMIYWGLAFSLPISQLRQTEMNA